MNISKISNQANVISNLGKNKNISTVNLSKTVNVPLKKFIDKFENVNNVPSSKPTKLQNMLGKIRKLQDFEYTMAEVKADTSKGLMINLFKSGRYNLAEKYTDNFEQSAVNLEKYGKRVHNLYKFL